jgi:hypothetical protein
MYNYFLEYKQYSNIYFIGKRELRAAAGAAPKKNHCRRQEGPSRLLPHRMI